MKRKLFVCINNNYLSPTVCVFVCVCVCVCAVISESDSDMEEDEAEKLAGTVASQYVHY